MGEKNNSSPWKTQEKWLFLQIRSLLFSFSLILLCKRNEEKILHCDQARLPRIHARVSLTRILFLTRPSEANFLIEAGTWETADELRRYPLPRAMTKTVHLSVNPSVFMSPFHNSSWRPEDQESARMPSCVTHLRVTTRLSHEILKSYKPSTSCC